MVQTLKNHPAIKHFFLGICLCLLIFSFQYLVSHSPTLRESMGIAGTIIYTILALATGFSGHLGLVLLIISFFEKKVVNSFLYFFILSNSIILGIMGLITPTFQSVLASTLYVIVGFALIIRAYVLLFKKNPNENSELRVLEKISIKKLTPIWIISLSIGFLMIMGFISAIPAGDEMGGLAEAFIVFLLFISVFACAIICNLILRSKSINTHIFINAIALIIICYSSWKTCIHRDPGMTPEEIQQNQIEELKDFKKDGADFIANAKLVLPSKETLESDKSRILSTLNTFLNKEISTHYNTKDSPYHGNKDSIDHAVFGYLFNGYLYGNDSVGSNKYKKDITDSLTIDFINYSPDLKSLFVILTYNKMTSGEKSNALVFRGVKIKNRIYLNKTFYVRDDYEVLNKEYAYYEVLSKLKEKNIYFDTKFWHSSLVDFIEAFNKDYIFQVNGLNGTESRMNLCKEFTPLILAE